MSAEKTASERRPACKKDIRRFYKLRRSDLFVSETDSAFTPPSDHIDSFQYTSSKESVDVL
jgi:hypothetical protein